MLTSTPYVSKILLKIKEIEPFVLNIEFTENFTNKMVIE